MANKRATIEAMFDEICDSLDNFENNSSKKLADYKELIEDIKSSVEICKEELEKNTKAVQSVASRFLCAFKPLSYQQEPGFNTSLPLALNKI